MIRPDPWPPSGATSDVARPTPFDDVASDWMEAPADDEAFAPPALTNQWAMLSVGRDVLSYEGFASPPVFASNLQAEVYVSIDAGPFFAFRDRSVRVSHRWSLDRVVRRAGADGLEFESVTAVSAYQPVAMVRLTLRNNGSEATGRRRVRLIVKVDPLVSQSDGIGDPSYGEKESAAAFDWARNAWVFGSAENDAWSAICSAPGPVDVCGLDQRAGDLEDRIRSGSLGGDIAPFSNVAACLYTFEIAPGESRDLVWTHALTEDRETALRLAGAHLETFDDRLLECRGAWEREWASAFTPGNALFSGHVPTLATEDLRLKRMYDMAIATLLYCKRSDKRAMGAKGYVYATGFPSTPFTFRVTSAFLWDIKMVAGILSMLDPEALRLMMESWMEADIHRGYGIDFVTKRPLGFWYAINDHALIHMSWQYLRYTGNWTWLDREVGGARVRDHLLFSAGYWRTIAGSDSLADYGTADNLLECVSTYTHKVASFNAANVWNMRTVADILERLGEREEPVRLRREADTLAKAVLGLYCPGEGFWACKKPDGSLVKVRHVLDFFTVMINMADDLSDDIKSEMVDFFHRELKEPTWMHALSPLDPDAATSSRTDHQDEGAYTTWPAYSVEALIRAGRVREAFDWLGVGREGPGIADVARQGPYGQAYHHGGEGSPMVCGAAAKAPLDPPHIEKPVLVSGGKYAQIVIESAVDPLLAGGVAEAETAIHAPVRFALRWAPIQGELYRVEAGPR